MTRLQRMAVTFALLLNVLGFGLVFLILANGDQVGDLVYLARTDVDFVTVVAAAGIVANIGLSLILVRLAQTLSQHRSGNPSARRPTFTGE